MTEGLGSLARKLRVAVRDPELFERALTHRSAGSAHNERLEYLGDALLGFVVAEQLYRRFPQASEGDLSRLRAALVRKQTLAAVAHELGLGEHIRLGPGELKSGGFRRESILADALESLFGAVYLDSGFDTAAAVVRRQLEAQVAALPDPQELKDPKTRLQELLQGRQLPLPEYRVVETSGEPHRMNFVVECNVPGLADAVRGSGRSRRKAEQVAAEQALARMLDG